MLTRGVSCRHSKREMKESLCDHLLTEDVDLEDKAQRCLSV